MPHSNAILFRSSSADSSSIQGDTIPALDRSWRASWGTCDRMDIKSFKAQFTQISPQIVRGRMVIGLDPRIPLPDVVLNFILKRVAGAQLVFNLIEDTTAFYKIAFDQNEIYIRHAAAYVGRGSKTNSHRSG